jgi:uncharacterized protein (TIGR02246 family)
MHLISTRIVAIALVGLGLTAAGGCSSSGQCPLFHSDKTMIESAKKLDADFMAAFNKGDADATAACYWDSPEMVMYPPAAMERRGWQAARDEFAAFFKNNPGAQLRLIDPQYRVAGPDVVGYGRWTVTQSNGQQLNGRYTEIMAKKDGKWVMVLDHPSVPMGGGEK